MLMPDIDGNREGSKYLWKIYGKMERSRNFTKVGKIFWKTCRKALKNTGKYLWDMEKEYTTKCATCVLHVWHM